MSEHVASSLAEIACRAIAGLGGGAAVARACGIKRSAVQDWKRRGIPPKHVPLVAQLSGLPMQALRPDMFPPPAPPKPAPEPARRRARLAAREAAR